MPPRAADASAVSSSRAVGLGNLKRGLRWRWRLTTAPLRRLPDFIIIGAQKSGTSSLYSYLARHPMVDAASKKEIHFFDDRAYHRGLNWYRAHFPVRMRLFRARPREGRAPITGEASPYYLAYPNAAERVASAVPRVKLIVMLRNPADRAISHYQHQRRKGREPLDLEQALRSEPERIRGERDRMIRDKAYYSYNFWAYSYLTRGVYADQIGQWMDHFGHDRFLFLKAEDFFASPSSEYNRVLRFLGLPAHDLGVYGRHNTGGYAGTDTGIRQWLQDYFRPHNERLYELIGVDYGW